MSREYVKISVYVPVAATRRALDGEFFDDPPRRILEVIGSLANIGAAVIGNYDNGTLTLRGVGRFRAIPGSGANPSTGKPGEIEMVDEEVISFVAPRSQLELIAEVIAKNHPYEVPAIEVVAIIRHRFDGLAGGLGSELGD